MRVHAAPGRTVPMEHNAREHIGSTPVDVPESTYYRRRVATGDLVEAEASVASEQASPNTEPTVPATKPTSKRTRGTDA